MIEVTFSTGIEEFDATLKSTTALCTIFEVLNFGQLNRPERVIKGQPIMRATQIEVAPYTNFDDQMAYVVKSYAELSNGRILLSDFAITQVWKQEQDRHVMSWIKDDGETIIDGLGPLAPRLALTADVYRLSHSQTSSED